MIIVKNDITKIILRDISYGINLGILRLSSYCKGIRLATLVA